MGFVFPHALLATILAHNLLMEIQYLPVNSALHNAPLVPGLQYVQPAKHLI